MSKIKPPKEKEKPLPIPKFVPLKPNLDLINAPLKPRTHQQQAPTEKATFSIYTCSTTCNICNKYNCYFKYYTMAKIELLYPKNWGA